MNTILGTLLLLFILFVRMFGNTLKFIFRLLMHEQRAIYNHIMNKHIAMEMEIE